jgi:hypothetical protein
MAKIHAGSTPVIERTIKDQDGVIVNLAGATVKKFRFKPSGGTLFVRDGNLSTDGTDGKMRYTLTDSETVEGSWQMQIYVEVGGKWYADTEYFEVEGNLV